MWARDIHREVAADSAKVCTSHDSPERGIGAKYMGFGGAEGARLVQQLGILASGSTLQRQLRHWVVVDPAQAPRVLGIDDWVWRKVHLTVQFSATWSMAG